MVRSGARAGAEGQVAQEGGGGEQLKYLAKQVAVGVALAAAVRRQPERRSDRLLVW